VHINVLSQCAPSPVYEGMWRHPQDTSAEGYRSLHYWTAMARELEAACIDALFLADIHGLYDVYQGSWHAAVRHGVQVPSIDPLLVVPAMALVTRQLGFAVTYSTTYHSPYECARVFTSLDHLTGGRVGWNIVTSYLESAQANGLGEHLPHDQRYDRAEEYVEVARRLWEDSWADDAVVRDPKADVFADPARIREIDHRGKWFSVRGPHQCEPSPQRTPVLYQAGASPRGTSFAAQHAEVAFLTMTDPASGTGKVAELRDKAKAAGRDPHSLLVSQGTSVILGETKADATARARAYRELTSNDGLLTKWCGLMGVDLDAYPPETPIAEIPTQASRTVVEMFRRAAPDKEWTVADVRYVVGRPKYVRANSPSLLYGTPEQVADRMAEWVEVAGVDGFTLMPGPVNGIGVTEICSLLVPELQRRGMFRTAYDPAETTLRERYFGAGQRTCTVVAAEAVAP
jgi:FMN-dependent oxidoreductase (nitrilotriacetate monooxygenase family)